MALRPHQPYDQNDNSERERAVDDMAGRQDDRFPAHTARELEKCNDRAGEGDGADAQAERHLDEARLRNRAHIADIESRRRIECGSRHQHGRHSHQRMECRDELRHGRHRHAAGDHCAHGAADRDPDDYQRPCARTFRRMRGERGDNGDRHSHHAEQIAPAAGLRIGEAA